MKAEAAMRSAILAMALDIIGEKTEKYASLEGRPCKDCPVLAEIAKDLRAAMIQDTELITDEMRVFYGV